MTSAYQEFIEKPIMVSPVSEIINQVYETNKDDEIFLSIDIKSANFSMLQYINVIDVHMYPTWSDFLSVFVGSRPLLIHSKRFRMDCLGDLPERRKLDALWIYYTVTMYQMVLCRCLTEKNIDIRCEALTGDEVVFHWKDEHLCFVRIFIDESKDNFDLKCLPHKDRNYDEACNDFRKLLTMNMNRV